MKKINVLFAAIIAMALAAGCASTSAPRMDAPDWVDQIAPEDVLWGIGLAKLQNDSLARDAATSRARRDVAAQLGTLVQSMLTDYARESGTLSNSASIQSIERITQELININLTGATPNAQRRMPDGTWWIRVQLRKADAQRVVTEVFTSEASRYADFRANEAAAMLQHRLAETQSTPSPRAAD